MSTERLIITIDDAELDAIIAKITTVKLPGDDPNKKLNELNKKIRDTRQAAKEAGISLEDLPTLNREMRMLANTLDLPLFREAQAVLFKGRLGVKAAETARQSAGLTAESLAPELASELAITSLVGYAALILFVTKMIADQFVKFTEDQNKKRIELEDSVRASLELTYREYDQLSKEQTGFATLFEQMTSQAEEVGAIKVAVNTLTEIIKGLIGVTPPIPQEYIDMWSVYVE